MTIGIIAFDADDTLWENEIYYRQGRQVFDKIMDRYQVPAPDRSRLDELEIENLKLYGYGAVGFAISMVEAGMQLTDGRLEAEEVAELLGVAKTIITTRVELMPSAHQVVSELSQEYPLMLITKGALVHQQAKIDQSGLAGYFRHVEIVAEKDPATYRQVFKDVGVPLTQVLMIGNSIRSDIRPIIELGGRAVHLTEHPSWDFEEQEVTDLPGDRFFQVKSLTGLAKLVEDLS